MDINNIKQQLNLKHLEILKIHETNGYSKYFLMIYTIQLKSNYDVKIKEFYNQSLSELELALSLQKKRIEQELILKNFLTEYEENLENKLIPSKYKQEYTQSVEKILQDVYCDDKSKEIDKANIKYLKKIEYYTALSKEDEKIKLFLEKLNIQEYHSSFSTARKIKRKLKLYIGPTNSGKTYHALNDLASHSNGAYLSPLRLLAWEGKEELEKRGHPTSLLTGEEKIIIENSSFSAQTIETLNFNNVYDCILIDEIQMIFDDSRGWAWTQAVMGAPCKELIMAGAPEAEEIVQKIANILGEELEVIRLNRFNPLEVIEPFQLERDLGRLPLGSALIAFSRKNVLNYKKLLESKGHKVSVIYGNLSPEVRTEEARKFRDGETDFLVSTDAIAMGLNLPISTVIFTTIEKFDGKEVKNLTSTEIKQIGGRAGRYGKVEKGCISAFSGGDIRYIKNIINTSEKNHGFVYIKPNESHIMEISKELNSKSLFSILNFFTAKVLGKRNDFYVCANLEQQKEIALLLDKTSLELEDKFLLSNAPVPSDDFYNMFINWIKFYEKGKSMEAPKVHQLKESDFNNDKLLLLESYVKLLNLYSWLSFKFADTFNDNDSAMNFKKESNKLIESILSDRQSKKNKK